MSKTRSHLLRAPRLVAVLAAMTITAACATNPATGKKELSLMSEAQEIQLGRQMDVEVRREMGVYNDPELQRYVESVGMRLAHASERPSRGASPSSMSRRSTRSRSPADTST